ncbi:MAG: imidazole glycerol phosphate synthase subunit HisH [Myxococcales bacterium]
MTSAVTIIDYDLGNLHSVIKAMNHEGAGTTVTSDPARVAAAERLVLPGVGAFADGMAALRKHHLDEAIHEYLKTGRPFLGICLGMQMLLTESDEFGCHAGLGVIPGRVEEIPREPGVKVPQIGWNRIFPGPRGDFGGSILESVAPGSMVYFVHSFTANPTSELHRLADTAYGSTRVSAAIQRDQIVGTQFHPEKSGEVGLAIIRRFLAL